MIAAARNLPFLIAALILVFAPAGASAARPVALTAVPARVSLTGTTREAVRVTNSGTRRAVVDASKAGFALTLRGRPRIVRARGAGSAVSWLRLRPVRLVLPARTSTSLLVSARVPRKAEPGDHDALVLLTTRPSVGARIATRVRLGVVVVVRAPGVVVRRLALRGLRVARPGGRRFLELRVANRGNVTETLSGVHIAISPARGGGRFGTLAAAQRDVRPHTQGILQFRLRRRVRGMVRAQVVIPGASGRDAIRGTYLLRL